VRFLGASSVFAQVVRVEPASEPQASSSSSGPCVLLPGPEAIPDAPDWAKPNRSWVQQFVADFQQLRVQVQHAYQHQGGARAHAGSASTVPESCHLCAWGVLVRFIVLTVCDIIFMLRSVQY
jgi:hypothetical protein